MSDEPINFNALRARPQPDLSEAMRLADQAMAETEAISEKLQGTVAEALAAMGATVPADPPPTFTGHSGALVARMVAEAAALKQVIASIDAEIDAENDRRDANVARLDAQRTDALLAYSMLAKVMQARGEGQ